MGLRKRYGRWGYRIYIHGRCYTETTGLDATKRNRNAAITKMEEHRTAILEGRDGERRIKIVPFTDAAEMFLTWAKGEYREHPSSARRLSVSFTSLKRFFGKTPVSAITEGRIEDYKAWRRTEHQVREVTLRHDLHALSGFYQYAMKQNWVRQNLARAVEIPSDADAVRMHVLTPAEETLYFTSCLRGQKTVRIKQHKRKGGVKIAEHLRKIDTDLRNLHDLGRLMLNQGCRPEELLSLRKDAVDLENGCLRILQGKSKAARRTLKLLSESRSILAARMQGDSPWIFPSEVKPGRHIAKLNNAHGRVLKETGLNFVIYDFRHTAATRWAERGMPLFTLAKILGHSRLRSVERYVHPSQAHMDEAMLRYGEFQSPSAQVGLRSVLGVKQGDSAGLDGNGREASEGSYPADKTRQIQ